MKDDAELLELKEKYLRALADYQNLEKQTQSWKEEFVKFANQNLILDLLEVLDDLEKAYEHLQDDGLKIIIEKMQAFLKNSGLEEINLENAIFDPNLCEAVETLPGEEDNKIAGVISKGYKLNGKVIRVSKVKVWQKS